MVLVCECSLIHTLSHWIHRSDTVLAAAPVQPLGVQRSEVTQEQHVPLLTIVPFLSVDKRLDMDADKQRSVTEKTQMSQ